MVRLGLSLLGALIAAAPAFAGDQISATLRAAPINGYGDCPSEVSFVGSVSAPLGGEVEYRFIRSDGEEQPSQKLYFDHPGSLPVGMTWHISARKLHDYRGWVAIQVVRPQHLQSVPATFHLRCGSGRSAGPTGLLPNDYDRAWGSRRREGFDSSGRWTDPTPVISLGPSYEPYIRWNGERIGGTPELEARLRDYRRLNDNCTVRVAPDRHADSQMVASLVSVIQRTNDCRTVDVGVIGSIGRAAAMIERMEGVENLPTIGFSTRSNALRWNNEQVSDAGALETRLRDYKRQHGDCQARIEGRGADYPAISEVFDAMIRAGCSVSIDGRRLQD